MNWQQLLHLIVVRIKQVIGLYAFVLIPMWGMFFLNEVILFGMWNIFGIVPRALDVGSMIGLFGLFEKNAYRTVIKLVVASGLVTWVIGSPSSIHIGASGLCFAMLGYMIGGAIFARRWGYLIACIVMGTGYWLTIKQGLMPQQGISFAAHFGGLCAGLLLGANSKHTYSAASQRY